LSRWALQRLRRDLPNLRKLGGPALTFSFGPLRHHLASNALAGDLQSWLQSGEIAPQELELRIAEKVLANLASPGATLRALAQLGVTTTVDEFGRGVTSLPRLARLPIRALQLDRALVLGAAASDTARKAVRGAIAVAGALELVAIASGVDDATQCDLMQQLGCTEGLGDLFPALSLPVNASIAVFAEPISNIAR
jgi:EAL domain-containing protein (putative c-di-GMP-specific phosphodiesterase class I)